MRNTHNFRLWGAATDKTRRHITPIAVLKAMCFLYLASLLGHDLTMKPFRICSRAQNFTMTAIRQSATCRSAPAINSWSCLMELWTRRLSETLSRYSCSVCSSHAASLITRLPWCFATRLHLSRLVIAVPLKLFDKRNIVTKSDYAFLWHCVLLRSTTFPQVLERDASWRQIQHILGYPWWRRLDKLGIYSSLQRMCRIRGEMCCSAI